MSISSRHNSIRSDPTEHTIHAPISTNDNIINNPLLPKSGVPITADDFVDSSERIINATNTNNIRHGHNNDIWNFDPSRYHDTGSRLVRSKASPNNQYDLGQFDIAFDRNRQLASETQRIKDLNMLSQLAEQQEEKSLYDLTITEIIINTKDAWFGLLDDLLDQQFEVETFTKENRLFYIGITLVFFAVIIYIYVLSASATSKTDNVKKVYHVYQTIPPSQITMHPNDLNTSH